MRTSRLAAAGVLLMLLAVSTSWAQDKRQNREREALRRAQANAATLQAEKADLERERGELAAKLETAARDNEARKGEAARMQQKIAELQKEIETLQGEKRALGEQLEKAGSAQADTRRELAETRAELAATQKALAQTREREADANFNQKRWEGIALNLREAFAGASQSLSACTGKNQELYDAAGRLLRGYIDRGSWDYLLPAEPPSGFRSVEIEKSLQDYDDRIRKLAVKPAGGN